MNDNPSQKMIIYGSSQYFGYGPTSNLFTILRALKARTSNIEIKLLEHEGISLFNQLNLDIKGTLVNNIREDADLVISSFDPFAIVYAWANNIKNIFYCNLFWFWDVFEKPKTVLKYRDELRKMKLQGKNDLMARFGEIFNKSPHHGIFLGYLLADYSFTRKFPNIEKYLSVFSKETKIEQTEILIPYTDLNDIKAENKVLIQLAGGINPVVTKSENKNYFLLILNLVQDLAKTFNNLEFLICANPHIIKLVKELPDRSIKNVSIVPSLSQQENMVLLKKSLAIFTSPGLETIYEAAHTNTPIFLLPEQNAGQYPILKMLRASGYFPDGFIINDSFPNRKKQTGEDDAHEIYECIKSILQENNKVYKCLLNKAESFLRNIFNTEYRNQYSNSAIKSIKSYMSENPFESADQIANFMLGMLKT